MRSSLRTYFNKIYHFIAHPSLSGCRKTLFVISSEARNLFFHIKLRFLLVRSIHEVSFGLRTPLIEMTDEKNIFNSPLRNFLVFSLSVAFILRLAANIIFGNFYNPYLYEYGVLLLTFITGFISLAQSRRIPVLICICIGAYSVIVSLLHAEIRYQTYINMLYIPFAAYFVSTKFQNQFMILQHT